MQSVTESTTEAHWSSDLFQHFRPTMPLTFQRWKRGKIVICQKAEIKMEKPHFLLHLLPTHLMQLR
jgi:hypothetical protein